MTAQGMSETWLPSPVFGDRYQVSSLGRVRSAKGIKSPYRDKDGYPVVNLHREGKRRACPVHRLVCRAFHGEQPNPIHKEVAHLDGNRANARADNLMWVGKIQNHFHMRAHGTHPAGEQHPRAKLTQKQVAAIRAETGFRINAELGRKFGVHKDTIGMIRRGVTWRVGWQPGPEGMRPDSFRGINLMPNPLHQAAKGKR